MTVKFYFHCFDGVCTSCTCACWTFAKLKFMTECNISTTLRTPDHAPSFVVSCSQTFTGCRYFNVVIIIRALCANIYTCNALRWQFHWDFAWRRRSNEDSERVSRFMRFFFKWNFFRRGSGTYRLPRNCVMKRNSVTLGLCLYSASIKQAYFNILCEHFGIILAFFMKRSVRRLPPVWKLLFKKNLQTRCKCMHLESFGQKKIFEEGCHLFKYFNLIKCIKQVIYYNMGNITEGIKNSL